MKKHLPVFFLSCVSVLGAMFIWKNYMGGAIGESHLASKVAKPSPVISLDIGPNLPPVGRSLFDFLTMQADSSGALQQVPPFPIEKMQSLIGRKIHKTDSHGLHGAMFPLGRSLQRMAAAPDFFKYPRVVMGIDAEPQSIGNEIAMLLRDRLYIGFNEKVSTLEVISYNELAGRYEFQVVTNYGPGKTPIVQYANRSVCIACHQNQAPIFSDAQWSETNANPKIASKLIEAMSQTPGFDGKTYAGFAISQSSQKNGAGENIVNSAEPMAIDSTKFRANLIPVTQFVWQKLCDEVDATPVGAAKCRYQALDLVFKMNLSGAVSKSHPALSEQANQTFLKSLMQAWNSRWAYGVAVPSPVIVDRDPLDPTPKGNPFDPSQLSPQLQKTLAPIFQTSNVISAEQEPLSPRAPMAIWTATPNANSPVGEISEWFSGLSYMFAATDWMRLDQWAAKHAVSGDNEMISATCQITPDGTEHINLSKCVASSAKAGAALSLLGSVEWDGDSGVVSGSFGFVGIDRTANGGGPSSCQFPTEMQLAQANTRSDCVASRNLQVLGQIELQQDGSFIFDLEPSAGSAGRTVRMSDGNRLARISFHYTNSTQVKIQLQIVRDYKYLQQAMLAGLNDPEAGAFGRRPFQRSQIMKLARAGLTGVRQVADDCCDDVSKMPVAQAQSDTDVSAENIQQLQAVFGDATPFMVNCAICHRNSIGFPPNYLYGTPGQVKAQLSQCAERINYRLNLWNIDASHRLVSAMPPMSRLQALGLSEEQWKNGPALQQVRASAATLLKDKGGSLSEILTKDYNSLPECKGN